MSWLLASLRRLRHDRLAFVGTALVVGLTAALAGGLPGLFQQVSADSIHGAISDLAPADRVVQMDQTDTGGTTEAPEPTYVDLSDVAAKADKLRATFPAPLPAVLGPSTYVVETPSYQALQGTALTAELRLRIMQGVDDHIRYVAGHAPGGTVGSAPDILAGTTGGDEGTPIEGQQTVDQVEVAVSHAAATKLGLKVGDTVFLAVQSALDPLAEGRPLSVKVVGIFEPRDTADAYWIDDERVLDWTLREFSINVTYVQATFLISPDLYPWLVTDSRAGFGPQVAPRRIEWRFPAEPQRLAPSALEPTVRALRRLQAVYPQGNEEGTGVVLDTHLLDRLVALQVPWQAAGAVLLVAGLGAAAVAVASLGLLILLAADPRRRTLLLERERGASAGQVLLAALVEGLLLALPAAAVGAVVVHLLLPAADVGLVVGGAAVVALLTVGLELAVVLPTILGPPRQPGREARIARRPTPRRLVFEGLAVVLAAAGAIMLHDRGLQAGAGTAVSGAAGVAVPTTVVGTGGPDLFLVIVPIIVGLAVALVAVRLAPLPMAGLARLSARRPGLGPVLAARRAARDSGAARILLIILATATLGGFASATILALDQSATRQAWHDVGAAYRVEPAADPLASIPALPDDFQPLQLPGVSQAVTAFVGPVAFPQGGAQQLLVALDPVAYERVAEGTPAAIAWPAAMLAAPAGQAASPSATAPATGSAATTQPLPALIAASNGSPFALSVGQTFQVIIGSNTVDVRAVGQLTTFPGLPAGRPFIILSRPQVEAVAPGRLRAPTTAFLRAPAADRAALTAALATAAPETRLVSQSAEAAALGGQPVVGVVSAGTVSLALLALLYAALAIVAASILAASRRAAETAHLATLGLSIGQAPRMLLAEYGPPALLAVLAGLALGLGLFAYLEPGLGLAGILGTTSIAPPGLDLGLVGLLVVLIGAILVLGVALGAPVQRRVAAEAVRRGLT
ncbi:MAG TPA: hypothetical protein VFW92_05980 [Candidatus Limnocylindrales bacterium]|nr:hypothetical protein [Candidatus Limnocylindrales bacterium]